MVKVNKKTPYFTPCSSVSIFNFGHVNADWDCMSSLGLSKYIETKQQITCFYLI